MPVLSDRVGTFTDSVIRRMTRINNQYNSINLSQGFRILTRRSSCWTRWQGQPMPARTSTL